ERLVGSEMCIRDSCPHSPGAKVRVRIPAAAIRVLAE
ncbi:hypothetical protein, partial [Pseudomonas aeruginosa]